MTDTVAQRVLAAVRGAVKTLEGTISGLTVVENASEPERDPPVLNVVDGDDTPTDRANGIEVHRVELAVLGYVDRDTPVALSTEAGNLAGEAWKAIKAVEDTTPEIFQIFPRGITRRFPDDQDVPEHLKFILQVEVEYHVDPDDPFSLPASA